MRIVNPLVDFVSMRVAFVAVLLVPVAIIGGLLGYYLGYQHLLPRISFVPIVSPTPVPSRVGGAAATPEATVSATLSPSVSPTPSVAPATVVDSFMKSFTQIKTTTANDPNAQNAVQFLTKDAQKVVAQESTNNSLASGLAKFAGVQSLPDGGYTIGKPTVTDNTIVIATTWNYLSGPVTKVFYLIQENGQWKIDTIRDR